jgi:hypothetical protein
MLVVFFFLGLHVPYWQFLAKHNVISWNFVLYFNGTSYFSIGSLSGYTKHRKEK